MSIINLPLNPSHKGSKVALPGNALQDQNFCVCLLGILLLRNGGQPITFSQADFDSVTGLVVLEGRNELNHFMIGLGYPEGKQG